MLESLSKLCRIFTNVIQTDIISIKIKRIHMKNEINGIFIQGTTLI